MNKSTIISKPGIRLFRYNGIYMYMMTIWSAFIARGTHGLNNTLVCMLTSQERAKKDVMNMWCLGVEVDMRCAVKQSFNGPYYN